MNLGLLLGYSGKKLQIPMDMVHKAESSGFDSVWVAEAYGSDAATVSSWVLAQTSSIKVGTAIFQIPGRTPAMTAMTAMSLAQLSNDRFILGLGASGPQVVEGWHGTGYAKPLTRLREHIEIVKLMMRREGPVEYSGEIYQLPYKGEGSVGLGKPLKSILGATDVPIYTASFTPGGFRVSGEVADGLFPSFASADKLDLITKPVEEGFAKAGNGKGWNDFDIAPFILVHCADDPEEYLFSTRQMLALYIGGMGAKNKNFYNAMACKMGYADAAEKVQDLYLAGKKEEAAAAVPRELIEEVSLTGTKEQIATKAEKWKRAEKEGYVKTLIMGISQPEMFGFMKEVFQD
ncbi:MAG: LLM class F420-dependent oxidoreductase [Pseudomonadales bacterium]